MTTWRLARRLAFSSDGRQRWRQVSVGVGGFLAALLVLLAAALLQAADDRDRRIDGRSPVWAQSEQDAVLRLSARGISLEGFGQFPVVWLEPSPGHDADPLTIPPGLRHLPRPGEAVLSEGLIAAGWSASDFGLADSDAGTGSGGAIGREGLIALSEGWLYARPLPGRSLGTGGALLLSRGYLAGDYERISFETVPEVPSGGEAVIGSAWMLVIPGLFLLLGSVRALSLIRDARAQTLWRFGVASRRIRGVLFVETALLLSVGVVPALLLGGLLLRGVSQVPLTVATVLPGAMAVEWWKIALLGLGLIVAGAGSAIIGTIRGRSVSADARRVRRWHAVPLAVAFGMMAVGPLLPPYDATRVYLLFGGLLLTFAALPMALPSLVAMLGEGLGRATQPAIWLAGRRLSLRSANLAKPAAMVGALVFVAGAAFALYDRLVTPEENVGGETPFAAFALGWRDHNPQDVKLAVDRSQSGFVVLPLSISESGDGTIFLKSCQQLDRWYPKGACAAGGQPSEQAKRDLEFALRAEVRVDEQPNTTELAVIADKSTDERIVLQQLAPVLPAPTISAAGGQSKTRDPRAGWMLLGWSLATMTLIVALVREIGDRALSSMRDVPHLLRLGLIPNEIYSSYRWTLFSPVAIAVPIGFAGAVLFALLGYELGLTIDNLARIALVAGIAGLLSIATFAFVMGIQRRLARV